MKKCEVLTIFWNRIHFNTFDGIDCNKNNTDPCIVQDFLFYIPHWIKSLATLEDAEMQMRSCALSGISRKSDNTGL